MILALILLAILLIIGIVAAFILLVGGAGVIAVFGDVIVFVLIVWLIVKVVKRIKKRK
jgi:hypothetical protein